MELVKHLRIMAAGHEGTVAWAAAEAIEELTDTLRWYVERYPDNPKGKAVLAKLDTGTEPRPSSVK